MKEAQNNHFHNLHSKDRHSRVTVAYFDDSLDKADGAPLSYAAEGI